MKTNRLLHYTVIALSFTAVIVTTAIVATPHLLENKHIRAQARVLLSKWAGGEFRIRGDIKVDYFLGAKFSATDVEITKFDRTSGLKHFKAKQLSADISWLSLLSGTIGFNRLSIVSPEFTFSKDFISSDKSSSEKLTNSPLTRLIRKAAVNRVTIHNGRMKLWSEGNLQEISNIYSKVYVSSRARIISGRSSFVYRDVPHHLTFRTKKKGIHNGVSHMYVKYSLKSELGATDFQGNLEFHKSIQAIGKKNIRIHNIRDFSKWVGRPLPDGSGLKDFQLSADMQLKDNKLTMSNSHLKMDGNNASGVLTVNLSDRNVDIGGTLDIPRLSLLPYAGQEKLTASEKGVKKIPFHFLKYITADLRVSAGEITAPKFQAWSSAMAISINSGKMLFDIADMRIFEGSARGQIEIDGDRVVPKISVQGYLQNISTSHCLENITNNGVMEGRASVDVSLTAEGKTLNKIIESLAGKWTVKMAAGGQVNMDLINLFAQTTATPVKGWNSFKNGVTRFKNLDISSDMQDGTANIKTVMLATDQRRYSGNGSIHIPNHSMNYQVTMSSHNEEDKADTVGSINNIALQMKGHWNAPEIAINPKP
ncbi:MAG: AsmA family protein [Methyloligellaceae bacterium]